MKFSRALALVAATAVAAAWCTQALPTATAKTTFESNYGYEHTWTAATRLVRVDLGLKVTEKDEAAGYLLFDYVSHESGKKATPGSLEFARSSDPNGPVHVSAHLGAMPAYHERVLLDELLRKLRADYGDAPRAGRGDAGSERGFRDAGSD
jgi:hypothetical protein